MNSFRLADGIATRAATKLVHRICAVAGDPEIIDRGHAGLSAAGVVDAVRRHDNSVLFEWLIEVLSYQGISDAAAASYMTDHGCVAGCDLAAALGASPSCPKLENYWSFAGCRFHKGSRTCAEPDHFNACPLPRHDLRKGQLNQAAYSLFLFLQDVTGGDLVAWIDSRLADADQPDGDQRSSRAARLRNALLGPLGHVWGVSNKVLSMALADLLLAADPDRPLWIEAGAGMIAIDSLVHNWLHRTGLLGRLGGDHPYGARCYGQNGCATIVEALAGTIDAREFNPAFPKEFPRFVQKAIWSFCAQSGFDQCNGNRIDDRLSCVRFDCQMGVLCERKPLRERGTS